MNLCEVYVESFVSSIVHLLVLVETTLIREEQENTELVGMLEIIQQSQLFDHTIHLGLAQQNRPLHPLEFLLDVFVYPTSNSRHSVSPSIGFHHSLRFC